MEKKYYIGVSIGNKLNTFNFFKVDHKFSHILVYLATFFHTMSKYCLLTTYIQNMEIIGPFWKSQPSLKQKQSNLATKKLSRNFSHTLNAYILPSSRAKNFVPFLNKISGTFRDRKFFWYP